MREAPFQIIVLLALVGILGAAAITRKRGWAATRGLWRKLAWYLGIVSALTFWFLRWPGQAGVIAVIIAVTGGVELVCVYRTAAMRRLPAALGAGSVYLACAAGFVLFADTASAACVTWVYLQVAVLDGFSQIAGQLAGRHKLAPAISPNKTVEGFVGGLLMTVVAGWLLHGWIGIGLLAATAASAGTAGCALLGDLLAARYKRWHGVKDYSGLIPAQGGMLDRFNGFLAAGAMWGVLGLFHPLPGGAAAAGLRDIAGAELAGAGILSAAFLLLLWGTTRLRQTVTSDAEISRKAIHVATGVLVMAIPTLLHSHWTVLALCASFGFLLEITRQAQLLPAVHAVGRTSAGCLCFPCAIYLCYRMASWEENLVFYYLPLLVLAISDTLAALIGRRARRWRYRVFGAGKSAAGVAAFFVSAAVVAAGVLGWAGAPAAGLLLQVLLVAAAGAAAEGLSGGGWDNLTVPVAVCAALGMLC